MAEVAEKEPESAFKNQDVGFVIESSDDEDDTTLDLAQRNLEQIPDHVTRNGDQVQRLILRMNRLSSLHNLEHFPNIRELQLDRNQITSLDDIPKLNQLTTLWLNNNQLNDVDRLITVLQRQCPRLEWLSLLRNPVCPSVYFDHGNESRHNRYRWKVLYHLKGLKFLDTTEVTAAERAEAEQRGPNLTVRKPKPQVEEDDEEDGEGEAEDDVLPQIADNNNAEPAAFLGKGRIKYDGRESEGNRFILNNDL